MQKKKPVVYSLVNNGLVYFSVSIHTRGVPHSLFTRVNERHHQACMLKLQIIFFSANIAGPILKSKFFGGYFRYLHIWRPPLFRARPSKSRSEAPARFSAPISTRLTIFMYLCSILACRSGRCDGGTPRLGGDSGAAGPANAAFRRGEGGPAC